MRYWWVNQNQTFSQEFHGGYLWSPKRKANGTRNPYYEYMREVAPGDCVFSFVNTRIEAFGIARSRAYEAPKPPEFGAAGRNWDAVGWRIDVKFSQLATQFRPADARPSPACAGWSRSAAGSKSVVESSRRSWRSGSSSEWREDWTCHASVA